MKRLALVAAAAALAVPAVFAQTVIVSQPMSHVLDHGAVAISPPVDGLPGSTVLIAPVALDSSNTTILGGPAATITTGSTMTLGGTALLDVPAYATSRPDFRRWLAWEGSHMTR
ncbi:MAG TPA: hypothetical protein VF522_22200 [Ramlibacter sp.]|uniref:hypothetical protein n=1 Tax=Ramlibacter sp. TaxID=1917967 RepID=UPI002ED0621B